MKFEVKVIVMLGFLISTTADPGEEEDPSNPHRNPSKCELCKLVALELEDSMSESGKVSEVLKIGHRFDQAPKEVKYINSELRLMEVLESVCEKILQYNIHAERQESRRFAKGTSETMQTLKNLRNKGVKVELGIPNSMWDEPSAAVTKMHQYCHHLIEANEEAIENWFFKTDQSRALTNYLCVDRVLSKEESTCLDEVWTGNERVHGTEDGDSDDDKYDNQDDKPKKKGKKKGKKKTSKPKMKGDPGTAQEKDEL